MIFLLAVDKLCRAVSKISDTKFGVKWQTSNNVSIRNVLNQQKCLIFGKDVDRNLILFYSA